MKSIFPIISIIFLSIVVFQAKAQDKIVIDDRTSVLNAEVETLLQKKFLEKNLFLTNSVDFRDKCDYYFSIISKTERGYELKVEDCNNKELGSVFAGSNLESISNEEKAVIIFYNFWDIINNPNNSKTASSKSESTQTDNEQNITADSDVAEHDSRYFFAPSALPLKERELYYNSLYFLLHDFQYGISDRFTIGMGTTIIGLPVYFTAKYSIPLQEKSHLAFGNMLMLGTYGTDFFGNLAFGTYTYGDSHNNFSIGGGHLYFNPGDNTEQTSSAVGNISGIVRAAENFYFLTENYLFNFKSTQYAYRNTALPDGTFVYQEAEYEVNRNVWYGLTGIRFVRKNNELVSWQLGLTHMLIVNSDIPAPYNSSEWETYGFNEGTRMIAFPTFSFTRKFKL